MQYQTTSALKKANNKVAIIIYAKKALVRPYIFLKSLMFLDQEIQLVQNFVHTWIILKFVGKVLFC